MLDPVWDPSGKARDALRSIVADFGTRALSSPSILDNVLHDLLPDSPKQVSLILATGGSSVAASLQEHIAQGMDADTAVRLAAAQLAEQTPYDAAGCRWVTGEFARALGYQVSDDTAPPTAGSPPSSPAPPAMPAPGPSPAVAADQAETLLPPDLVEPQAASTGSPPARRRRRRLPIVVAVLVVVGGVLGGAAATNTWPFGTSPVALRKLLPGDVTGCTTKVTPFKDHLAGMTSVLACQVNAISGVLFAYQFDSVADYQSALSAFNQVSGFDANSATSTCPPPSGRQGETSWFTTETSLYPKIPGQNLECYTVRFNSDANNPLQPIYVWTIPTENTFLQAIAGSTTTAKELDTWWTHNGGPDAK